MILTKEQAALCFRTAQGAALVFGPCHRHDLRWVGGHQGQTVTFSYVPAVTQAIEISATPKGTKYSTAQEEYGDLIEFAKAYGLDWIALSVA